MQDCFGRRMLAFCAMAVMGLASVDANDPHRSRQYATDYLSQTFFIPRQIKIDAVGLLNEDTAYVATRSGIKALRAGGSPTPVIEVDNEEIVAFHLCHHRSSIIYEVLSRDGGALSIYEYSIPVRMKVKVKDFQDTLPANALSCVDQWILRVSPAALQAVHIATGTQSELRGFQEAADAISSLSVAYSADIVANAEVYAAHPNNSTISRLRLQDDGSGKLREESSDCVLSGGAVVDGPIEVAAVKSPHHVVWTNGKILFTDGCMLREFAGGHVRTVFGRPTCVPGANETLEPVPWATRLSQPQALAISTEGTAATALLLLTETQVVRILHAPNACAAAGMNEHGAAAAGKCSEGQAGAASGHQSGCAWADAPAADEQLCFECSALEKWATLQRPQLDLCSIELSPRQNTTYSLSGCGCVAPSPGPADAAEVESERIQANLSILLVVAVLAIAVLLYRRGRRVRGMQELYGVDTGAFHTFTDQENTCEFHSNVR